MTTDFSHVMGVPPEERAVVEKDEVTAVRQSVFSDEECRVLAGVVGTTFDVVDTLGRLAWRKQQERTG